jgi:acyl-CoA thioesterase I
MRMSFYALFLIFLLPFTAHAEPLRVIALGDSLTSGYGLQNGDGFVPRLQAALRAAGHNVTVENAGVAGDTTAGGVARLDWTLQGAQKPNLVIVALGANDMLRGINPTNTRENLSKILSRLKKDNINVLLVGMKSPTNMVGPFRNRFDKIYPDLAKEFNVPLYPFFLKDVAMVAAFNQADGIHPNEKGVDVMVKNMLPVVKKSLKP